LNPQFSLEKRLAYRFSILSTLNVRCIGSVYTKKFGLSTAGWRIMSIIGRFEPIFPGVAGQMSTMDADKVTRAVDRLVEMGYVIRNTDAADRRRVILCLTSRGRAVYEEVEELSQGMDAKWRSVLTKEEGVALDAIMDKLDARARELFTEGMAEQRIKAMRPPTRGSAAKRAPAKKAAAAPAARKRSRAA
jgi:DNA-binding MarR family transcriptional regulator